MGGVFKKLTALAVALSVMTVTIPVYAEEYHEDGSATVPITATVEGSYTVTLPASLDLEFTEYDVGSATLIMLWNETPYALPYCSVDLQKNKLISFGSGVPGNDRFCQILKDGVATDLWTNVPAVCFCNPRTVLKDEYTERPEGYPENRRLINNSAAIALGVQDAADSYASVLLCSGASEIYEPLPVYKRSKVGARKLSSTLAAFLSNSAYGPGTYTCDLPITWRTVTIPDEMLAD